MEISSGGTKSARGAGAGLAAVDVQWGQMDHSENGSPDSDTGIFKLAECHQPRTAIPEKSTSTSVYSPPDGTMGLSFSPLSVKTADAAGKVSKSRRKLLDGSNC